MRKRVLAVTFVAGLLAIAGCSDGQVQRSDDAAQIGYIAGSGAVTVIDAADRDPAPEFGGPLLGSADDEFWLDDARGDVVVLNVWGSWCPPCREEAPAFQAVYSQLADDGVQFIGVNTRDNETDAIAFEDEFAVTYPSVVDTDGRRMLAFRDTLPPNAIPTTLIVDRDGNLAARVLGAVSETTLRELITDVLDDPSEEAAG
jgi:thiol-disulfide isomerase/thioredoxin